MSYQAVNAALNKAKVTGVQMLVLICMAEDSRDSKTCRTGPERIALRSGASMRSVRYAISELVASGHLSMIAKGGGRNRPSVYALSFMEMADKDGLRRTAPVEADPETVQSDAKNSATTAPFKEAPGAETVQSVQETVQSATLNSATIAPKPVGTGKEPVTPLPPDGGLSVDEVSSDASDPTQSPKPSELDEALEMWEKAAKAKGWTPVTVQRTGAEWSKRKRSIRKLLADHGIDGWRKALTAACRNDHANGRTAANWHLKLSSFIRAAYFQDRLDEAGSTPGRSGVRPMPPVNPALQAMRLERDAREAAASQAATFPQHIH